MPDNRIVLIDQFLYDLNVPYVTTDNINASYKLTKLLLNNGHRKLAFVSGKTISAQLKNDTPVSNKPATTQD